MAAFPRADPHVFAPEFELRPVRRQAALVRFDDGLAVEDRLREVVRQAPLEEPRQGDRQHEILGQAFEVDDLMRDTRPEDGQPSRGDDDLPPAHEIDQPPVLQEVELDLVVAVATRHRRRRPAHAAESVRREIGTGRVEAGHDLRIPQEIPRIKGVTRGSS